MKITTVTQSLLDDEDHKITAIILDREKCHEKESNILLALDQVRNEERLVSRRSSSRVSSSDRSTHEKEVHSILTQKQQLRYSLRVIRDQLDALDDSEEKILNNVRDMEDQIVYETILKESKRWENEEKENKNARASNIDALLQHLDDSQLEEEEEEEEEMCCICFDNERSEIDTRIVLRCGHSNQHSECLNDWIQTNFQTTCPMCRAKITQKDINQVKHMLSIVQQRRKLQKEQRLKEKEIAKREKIQQQKIEKAALQKREDIKRQKNLMREFEHVSNLAEMAEQQAAEMALAASERLSLLKEQKEKMKTEKEARKKQSSVGFMRNRMKKKTNKQNKKKKKKKKQQSKDSFVNGELTVRIDRQMEQAIASPKHGLCMNIPIWCYAVAVTVILGLAAIASILEYRTYFIFEYKNSTDSRTLLFQECSNNNVQAVRSLLMNVQDPVDDILLNQADEDGITPLHVACHKGHFEVAKSLLHMTNIEVNLASHRGLTPLYVASTAGHFQIVKMLLMMDKIQVNQASNKELTPLFVACHHGHTRIVELLLEADGIQVNHATINDGRTPLYVASQKNHLDIVRLLLKADGIEINKSKSSGSTPLYIASLKGHSEVVNMLLKMDKIQVNIEQMHAARKNGHIEIYELLRQHTTIKGLI
jgi:ankyrin repeat protein